MHTELKLQVEPDELFLIHLRFLQLGVLLEEEVKTRFAVFKKLSSENAHLDG